LLRSGFRIQNIRRITPGNILNNQKAGGFRAERRIDTHLPGLAQKPIEVVQRIQSPSLRDKFAFQMLFAGLLKEKHRTIKDASGIGLRWELS